MAAQPDHSRREGQYGRETGNTLTLPSQWPKFLTTHRSPRKRVFFCLLTGNPQLRVMATESYTEQQRLFCKRYALHKKKKQAAIDAGYSPRTASVTASKLLKLPKIVALIAQLESHRETIAEAREVVDRARILHELECIGTVDPRRLFDADGKLKAPGDLEEVDARAIAGFKLDQRVLEDGTVHTKADLRFWDKPAALKLLGVEEGMFRDKVEHVHKLGDMSLEELVAERDRLKAEAGDLQEQAKANGIKLGETRH